MPTPSSSSSANSMPSPRLKPYPIRSPPHIPTRPPNPPPRSARQFRCRRTHSQIVEANLQSRHPISSALKQSRPPRTRTRPARPRHPPNPNGNRGIVRSPNNEFGSEEAPDFHRRVPHTRTTSLESNRRIYSALPTCLSRPPAQVWEYRSTSQLQHSPPLETLLPKSRCSFPPNSDRPILRSASGRGLPGC